MNTEDIRFFNESVDKSQVPPIHQKRILAFVNHFIISTCSFLNDFALKCENKFIEVERKLQNVEASLTIIESKLSSISGLDDESKTESIQEQIEDKVEDTKSEYNDEIGVTEIDENPNQCLEQKNTAVEGVKASTDARYRKYFKMVLFGVPANAVKIKMSAEGYDANILDNPDAILSDGIRFEEPEI